MAQYVCISRRGVGCREVPFVSCPATQSRVHAQAYGESAVMSPSQKMSERGASRRVTAGKKTKKKQQEVSHLVWLTVDRSTLSKPLHLGDELFTKSTEPAADQSLHLENGCHSYENYFLFLTPPLPQIFFPLLCDDLRVSQPRRRRLKQPIRFGLFPRSEKPKQSRVFVPCCCPSVALQGAKTPLLLRLLAFFFFFNQSIYVFIFPLAVLNKLPGTLAASNAGAN